MLHCKKNVGVAGNLQQCSCISSDKCWYGGKLVMVCRSAIEATNGGSLNPHSTCVSASGKVLGHGAESARRKRRHPLLLTRALTPVDQCGANPVACGHGRSTVMHSSP
eukprot:gene839-7899_t